MACAWILYLTIYSIANSIGVFRRANGQYFQCGMSGLEEKGRFGGLDKKTVAGRPWLVFQSNPTGGGLMPKYLYLAACLGISQRSVSV